MTNHGYRTEYLYVEDPPANAGESVLYRDPLTSLIAYPSFEEYLIATLPVLAAEDVHMAIGDVDGLREYVTERRAADPDSFGHLAGNACMRAVGALTSDWAREQLKDIFHVCGTFGGDEVIVAASGLTHAAFADKLQSLCRDIKASSPRPCSFALATLESCMIPQPQSRNAYRALVSLIDSQLFAMKENARLAGEHLEGAVADLGMVSLGPRGNDQHGIECLTPIGAGE